MVGFAKQKLIKANSRLAQVLLPKSLPELAVLRRENRSLKEEFDIVKRAEALFATDNILPK